MLDDVTAVRLVTLRALFELAKDRVQDPTPAGRHAALVLLDGACELCLRHAAEQLRVKLLDRDNFEAVYDKVAAAMPQAPDGWAGVRQMRRGRNLAQHGGVLPDPGQLAGWATACDTFLHSLTSIVFKVVLADVHRADALTYPVLQGLFAQAEDLLASDDPKNAVAKAAETFNVARRIWRGQRAAIGLNVPKLSKGIFSDSLGTENALIEIHDLIEVDAFAPDMGEYLSFISLTARPGPDPSKAEAERALTFVFNWALRWEAFSARYDDGLLRKWRQGLRPPSTSRPDLGPRLDDVPAVIVSGSALPSHNPFVNVRLQLVDAPDADFVAWLAYLQAALVDQWKAASPVESYAFPTVDRKGLITLPAERPEIDAVAVTGMIRAAIELANQRVKDEASDVTLSAHRYALSSFVDEDQRPFFLEARGSFVEDADDITLKAALELVPRPDIEAFVRSPMFAHIVQSATRSFARIDGPPLVMRVARSVEPEGLVAALKHALQSCREEAAKSSEERRLTSEIEADVRQRFLDAL